MKFLPLGSLATSLLVLSVAAVPPARVATESDAVLATWLSTHGAHDVELARIAVPMAKHDDVKQLAQRIAEDQAAFAQRLQPFVDSNVPGGDRAPRGKPGQDPLGNRQAPVETGGLPVGFPIGGFDQVTLLRELGRKCLESESRLLREQAGPHFDAFYVDLQIVGHQRTLDMIEVFGRYASEPLREVLDAGSRTLQGHLELAKALGKRLAAPAEVAPKPAAPGK